jgi:glucokinase
VLVTLGTGVGGGVVIDGRLLSGGSGIAAEFGHLKVGSDGRACPCGREDCLEQYASGVALGRAGQAAVARDHARGRHLLALATGDPARIDGRMVTAAARERDPLAVRLVGEAGTWLGRGLAQIAAVLDPSLILVGGGLALADELVLAPARTAYLTSVSLRAVRPLPPIRAAALGNMAGVIGIAALARSARPPGVLRMLAVRRKQWRAPPRSSGERAGPLSALRARPDFPGSASDEPGGDRHVLRRAAVACEAREDQGRRRRPHPRR